MRPQAALLCSATWSWSTGALRAARERNSRRLPPTPRWVRDALGWGWPGESPELCGSRSGSLLSEGLRSPPPSSQPPLSQACSGKHLSLRPWLDPIWGQASQPWMCRPRGLSDLHGDLITRSHSWSLPKRFSAFRPQTANRQSSFPPRFVNNLRGPEGPSPYPGSTYPVSFAYFLTPHPAFGGTPFSSAACKGSE